MGRAVLAENALEIPNEVFNYIITKQTASG